MGIYINLWVLLFSIIFSVILGFIWYGPLFGKKWMELNGMKMPDPKPSFKTMLKPMGFSFFGAFCMSFVLARIILIGNAYLGTSGISSGLATACMVWIGFIVPAHISASNWEGKSWKLFWINTGYWLVYLFVVGGLTALFA